MSDGTRTAKRVRREERRTQLLDAAIQAIRDYGPGASMEQLAAAGGVTKPILYRHFGDREGLVTAIGDIFADQLVSELSAQLEADTPPRELLENTVDSYVRFIERDPDLYQFLVQYAVSRPAGVEVVVGLMDSISRQVAVVLGEALGAAGRDTGAAEPWAFGIVGMVHNAGNWWVANRTMSRNRLVEYLTALLWDGLSEPTSP